MFREEEIDVETNFLVTWLNLTRDKMKKENVFKGEDFLETMGIKRSGISSGRTKVSCPSMGFVTVFTSLRENVHIKFLGKGQKRNSYAWKENN